MKQFLESLIKSIVENPEAVNVEESQDDKGRFFFSITVDDNDMGRVIGKSGSVINAIRTIMRVVAIRQGVKISIDVVDKGQPPNPQPTPQADSGDSQPQEPSASDLVQAPEESQPEQPAKPAQPEAAQSDQPQATKPEDSSTPTPSANQASK